jgi:hypothetical protein
VPAADLADHLEKVHGRLHVGAVVVPFLPDRIPPRR